MRDHIHAESTKVSNYFPQPLLPLKKKKGLKKEKVRKTGNQPMFVFIDIAATEIYCWELKIQSYIHSTKSASSFHLYKLREFQ